MGFAPSHPIRSVLQCCPKASLCNNEVLGEGMCDNREEMLHRVAQDETNGKMNRRVGVLDRINQVIDSRVHHGKGLKSCFV